MEDLMASIAVKIPTSAMIPIAIIKTVRVVRSNWVRIEPNDILIFSLMNEAINNDCAELQI
jgi:hypothetical protein